LRDGVRVLADAQADWIKSLTSVKGYLRNGGSTMVVAAPPKTEPDKDETTEEYEEEEYEEEEYVEKKHWTDRVGEAVAPYAPAIMAFVGQKLIPSGDAASMPGGGGGGLMETIRNTFDWRRAAEIGAAKRAEKATTAPSPPAPPASLMQAFASAPPEVVAKVMAVRQQLSPDEQARLMRMFAMLPPEELPVILADIQRMPIEELAVTMREVIAGTAAPSTQAPAKE
jgi:hypothetical protein